jgi:hypothetical protein
MKNLIFEAIDSVINPSLDESNCLGSQGLCCFLNGNSLGGASACSFVRKP